MKKIITILIIILSIYCIGCIENNDNYITDEEKIIGTWVNTSRYINGTASFTYIFSNDNTFEMIIIFNNDTFGNVGTWEIKENLLNLNIEGNLIKSNYNFSNKDQTLTITDSPQNTMNFDRQ